jgi:hypothetical protein
MKYSSVFLAGMLLLFTFSSCSDDSSCVDSDSKTNLITGTVLYADSLNAAGGAVVFMSKGDPYAFLNTVPADEQGIFQFHDVSVDSFYLYAGKINTNGGGEYSHISFVSDNLVYAGEGIFYTDDILLYDIFDQSSITGQVVTRRLAPDPVPADSADVLLYNLSGMHYEAVDSAVTDTLGWYTFENVKTGNYIIWAGKDNDVAESGHFFCGGVTPDTADVLTIGDLPVRKPAIYIYPEEDAYFEVCLVLNNGTVLTKSEPEYGSGWNVFVETSGRIDHRYDYLFYEAALPDVPTLSSGWCIPRDDLASELPALLIQIGLNETEIEDLMEYWLGYLTDCGYYSIYPIFDHSLDDMVELHVTPQPGAVLRFWLFFEGRDDLESLPPPQLPGFSRAATTVIEWGGVLLD